MKFYEITISKSINQLAKLDYIAFQKTLMNFHWKYT